jgi:virginiamycin B lyase
LSRFICLFHLNVILLSCASITAKAAPDSTPVFDYPAAHALPGEIPAAVFIDGSGYVYLAGTASGHVYVTKLDPTGESRIYTAHLGGSDYQRATGIAFDSTGNAYVTGYTSSKDFPVNRGLQRTAGGGLDAFVAKLDPTGSTWLYSTYLGGTGDDIANAIAVDVRGNAYVTGSTTSADFPMRNAAMPQKSGEMEGFVAEIGWDGGSLLYSTYLGGGRQTSGNGLAIDASGAVLVAGAHRDAGQAFLMKIAVDGLGPIYERTLPENGQQEATSVAIDAQGAVYVAGWRESQGRSIFAAKYGANGDPIYSTTAGGNAGVTPPSIATDSVGSAYVAFSELASDGSWRSSLVTLSPSGATQAASQSSAVPVAWRGVALAIRGQPIVAGTDSAARAYAGCLGSCGPRSSKPVDSPHAELSQAPVLGSITEFPIPISSSLPVGITTGPDGNLWFTDHAGFVGTMTPAGVVTTHGISGTSADGIVTGPDGNLWFTDGHNIGQMTTGGVLSEFAIPNANDPRGITVGPDGALWFAEYNGDTIANVTTGGVFTEHSVGNSGPINLVTGPDGALWFTDWYEGEIGRMTTSGSYVEYPIPTSGSHPTDIAVGSDGALWFTEQTANKIGRITTTQEFTEYPIQTSNSQPTAIVAGPDGALWFTQPGSNEIG